MVGAAGRAHGSRPVAPTGSVQRFAQLIAGKAMNGDFFP